jgi:hypothetical protein
VEIPVRTLICHASGTASASSGPAEVIVPVCVKIVPVMAWTRSSGRSLRTRSTFGTATVRVAGTPA